MYVPSTIKTIGEYAFYSNDSLTTLMINDGVESVGKGSFYSLKNVRNFAFPKSLKNIDSMGFYYFAKNTEGFVIPKDCQLEQVGSQAFSFSGLVSGDFSQLTSIGEGAFYYCQLLNDIKLSAELENIPNTCFNSCTSLTNIDLPDSLTTIGQSVFAGCTALEEIVLPEKVTSISYN